MRVGKKWKGKSQKVKREEEGKSNIRCFSKVVDRKGESAKWSGRSGQVR